MPAVRILRLFRICQVDGVMYSRAANEMLLITKYIKDGTMKRNVVLLLHDNGPQAPVFSPTNAANNNDISLNMGLMDG